MKSLDDERRKRADREMWKRMAEPTRPCPKCGKKQWTRWSSSVWQDCVETKHYCWFCPSCHAEEAVE